jgi:hypothetical protein
MDEKIKLEQDAIKCIDDEMQDIEAGTTLV